MHKSYIILALFLLTCSLSFAQKNINGYKYIIVPKQYEFQRSPDRYQVNSLTKFLFERAGFIAHFSGDVFPEDLARNPCLALKANVVDQSKFLKTIMNVELLDCQNNVVFATIPAQTKEKDYKLGYHEVIRETFVGIENLDYKYDPSINGNNEVAVKTQPEVIEVAPKVIEKKEQTISTKSLTEKTEPKKAKAEEKVMVVKSVEKSLETKTQIKSNITSIVGKFDMGKWGACTIVKNNDEYSVIGGTEKFTFATIFETSKKNIYIIKWVAYKQPQLLELKLNGDLKVDAESGSETYKRGN